MVKHIAIAVLLLSSVAFAQGAERDAESRFLAAIKRPKVTVAQCKAELLVWDARDNQDDKNKTTAPNYWFEKMSTEELYRLRGEASSCSLGSNRNRGDRLIFQDYETQFTSELLDRAEQVLITHSAIGEYLLQGNPDN